MTPESKQQVQGAFFNLLIATNANVGDVLDIAYGLMYMTLMTFHNGDTMKVIADLRKAADNACEGVAKGDGTHQQLVMPGVKLDS